MTDGEDWARREREDAERRALIVRTLEHRGFKDVALPTPACPVQVIGLLPSGEWFYLRARGRGLSLDVYARAPVDEEPLPPRRERLAYAVRYEDAAENVALFRTERTLGELLAACGFRLP